MSYLRDKEARKRRVIKYSGLLALLLIIFYFRAGIGRGLSFVATPIFRPILQSGNGFGSKFTGLAAYFSSKSALLRANEELTARINADEAQMVNYNSMLAEVNALKQTLGRLPNNQKGILAAILEKPNQSPYDTLLIDGGMEAGIRSGNLVYALGNVPIGKISDAYDTTAKVVLFSAPGIKTEAVAGDKNTYIELSGRGGGNFEMILPKELTLKQGDLATLPGINGEVLGIVQTIISDPRDAFAKALLVSPVNIQELKFVEVKP